MAGAKQIPQRLTNIDDLITEINIVFNRVGHYDPAYVMPEKIEQGDIYYFGAELLNTPITSEGLWQVRSDFNWVKIG